MGEGELRETLLALLLGDDARALAAARALAEGGAWPEAVRRAVQWRAAPQLRLRAALLGGLPTGPALARACAESYPRSALAVSHAVAAARALAQAGLPVAAFKGVAVVALLYGGPQWRTLHDADLLIRARDLEAAVARLGEAGYRSSDAGPLADYAHFVAHAPAFAGNRALVLRGPGGSEIDLHWAVGGAALDPGDLLHRARPVRVLDAWIPTVAAEDGLLLTVRHAVRENLVVDGMARDLVDARGWCAHLRARGRLAAAVERAAACGETVPVLVLLSVLAEADPAGAAAEARGALASRARSRERRAARELVELFRDQTRRGPVEPDLLYVAHGRPLRQIAAGLSTGWGSYRRHMRIMERRLLGETLPWPRRAMRLVRELAGQGLGRLRRVRALARVKYRAPQGK